MCIFKSLFSFLLGTPAWQRLNTFLESKARVIQLFYEPLGGSHHYSSAVWLYDLAEAWKLDYRFCSEQRSMSSFASTVMKCSIPYLPKEVTLLLKKIKYRNQSDSTAGKVLALHMSDLNLILGIPYDILSTTRSNL